MAALDPRQGAQDKHMADAPVRERGSSAGLEDQVFRPVGGFEGRLT